MAEVAEILKVKGKHEDELLRIPSVVGVEISLAQDGHPIIQVLVKEKAARLRSRIPRKLEGYDVGVKEVGSIQLE